MSHHGWSRVGKSTEGRWSGVKSTDSNPLVYIQVQGTWLLPGLFLDRSRNAYIDSTEFRYKQRRRKIVTLLLTLTIGETLLGQIVASSLVTDGRARFATFVVAAAILDRGAMFFAAFRSIVIQRCRRAAHHQQQRDQQCHRRWIHPRIVTRRVRYRPLRRIRFELNDVRKNRLELETYLSWKSKHAFESLL